MSDFATTGAGQGGAVSGSAPSAPAGNAGAGAPASPSFQSGGGDPVRMTEDSLFIPPGAKEPVKYGDYYRNFQSEFTRRAQEAAKYRQEAERYQQTLREREAEIQRYRQAFGNGQNPNGGQGSVQDIAQQLKTLPYLKGEDAARLADHITQQLTQRDQNFQQAVAGMALMYRQMQQMQQELGEFRSRYQTSDFESKIGSAMKQIGVPESAAEWAKEIYLAYEEGPELDREFPSILQRRWEQLQNLTREADRQKARDARQQPFTPGRGGQGSPSKPLSLAGKSAAERADLLWESLGTSDT